MGRFNHEAVASDTFGNAYLTEDRSDGLLYKFKPKNRIVWMMVNYLLLG